MLSFSKVQVGHVHVRGRFHMSESFGVPSVDLPAGWRRCEPAAGRDRGGVAEGGGGSGSSISVASPPSSESSIGASAAGVELPLIAAVGSDGFGDDGAAAGAATGFAAVPGGSVSR